VLSIDGHDPDTIYKTLDIAQKADKPTFIACRTKIGYGSPNFEGSEEAHGKSLGIDEIALIKKNFDWDYPKFTIPTHVLKLWRNFYKRNSSTYSDWQKNHQAKYAKFQQCANNTDSALKAIQYLKKSFLSLKEPEATRKSSQKVIGKISQLFSNIIGGSADLSGSNGTKASNQKNISHKDFSGSYLHYGVREHAMVAIMSGLSTHSGCVAYGGTFLVFSDYCRPAIRLAALMKLPIILVFTHDSIGLGEDGPTHQPIEHLATLRAIPNLNVFRPADATETTECWDLMLRQKTNPSAICLSRQSLPQIRNSISVNNTKNLVGFGSYILYQSLEQEAVVSIFASGSEVSLAMYVAKALEIKGVGSKVISVPCQELFWQQPLEYQMALLCNNSLKVAIEAGIEQSWSKIIGPHGVFFGIENYGKSAPAKDLYQHFELDSKRITYKILKIINPTN
jgi:transketolase